MEFPIRRRAPISEGPVVVILAIGLDSPIGHDGAARDPRRRCTRRRAGRGARFPLRPLCRRAAPIAPRRHWRVAEPLRIPAALEVRPTAPRVSRAAPAARLVVGIALAVVISASPRVALIVALCGAIASCGSVLLCWLRAYIRREFVQQWRLAAWVCPPIVAFWTWMWLLR